MTAVAVRAQGGPGAERKSWSVGTSRSEQHAETAASVASRIFEPPLLVGYALRLAVSFRRMQQ